MKYAVRRGASGSVANVEGPNDWEPFITQKDTLFHNIYYRMGKFYVFRKGKWLLRVSHVNVVHVTNKAALAMFRK